MMYRESPLEFHTKQVVPVRERIRKGDYRIIEVKRSIFEDNNQDAERLRSQLKHEGTFLVNLMSSPGAGKTTTLKRTIAALRDEVKIGVMEADIDGEVDAVIPEYLTDCWKWAVRRTEVMRDARLEIEKIPAVTHCDSCGRDYPTVEHGRTCPFCGSGETWLKQGNEFIIKQIEAEQDG